MGVEGVGREVVVRGAHVGVAQGFAHHPQRAVVVPGHVVVVDDDLGSEAVRQVEEVLLLVSDDHRDVGDAGGVQLFDLPLNETLAAHAQRALGALIGDRGEALGKARGHDDRVVDPVGLQCFPSGLRDAPLVEVPGGLAHAHGGIDPAQRHPGGFLNLPLRQRGVRAQEGVQDVELGLRERACHRLHHVRSFSVRYRARSKIANG